MCKYRAGKGPGAAETVVQKRSTRHKSDCTGDEALGEAGVEEEAVALDVIALNIAEIESGAGELSTISVTISRTMYSKAAVFRSKSRQNSIAWR